jgi:SAM-dependent methyltransferase
MIPSSPEEPWGDPDYPRMVTQQTREIPQAIVARLRCPSCGEPISNDGGLSCQNGHEMVQRDGYIDASATPVDARTEQTFASFGYEWTVFDKVQPEDERFFRGYFAEIDLASLRDEVGLDAGCGKGRFSRFMAGHLQAILSLDGSDAVRAAARNLVDVPNACVLRADLRTAPLQEASFGFVSCLGVLHHLTEPEIGFQALVRMLSPGGTLLVYLYSRPSKRGIRSYSLQAAGLIRHLTTHLPHTLLRFASAPIAAALYAVIVVPGSFGERRGNRFLTNLPLAVYRRNPLRALWLDTFDRLSAPIETRYTWDDIRPWFERAELRVQSVSERGGLVIVARKVPTAGGDEAASRGTSEPESP